jgi:hypothetical protein
MLSSKQLFTSIVEAYFSARTGGLALIHTRQKSCYFVFISHVIFNTIFLHDSSTIITAYNSDVDGEP